MNTDSACLTLNVNTEHYYIPLLKWSMLLAVFAYYEKRCQNTLKGVFMA